MQVTLKDIANLTGVSLNTVSRALKDMPDIGTATKERIRKTANALGYTPNILARGLAIKRSFTIGMVSTELNNPVRSAFIEELRRVLRNNGYQLLVSGYEKSSDIEKDIREMSSRSVDGIVLGNVGGILSEQSYWPALQAAINGKIPVLAFYHVQTTILDNIFVNYSKLAEDLTSHLIEKHGLKDIRFAGTSTSYDRYAGYQKAMKAAGLKSYIKLIELKDYHMAPAHDSLLEYLKTHSSPEAIVCHNDLTAIGVMAALRSRGLYVPENVAVAGIDNIESAVFLNPPLTTAGINLSRMAEKIFRMLSERINGKYTGEGRRLELPFEMFFRESCGCKKSERIKKSVTPLKTSNKDEKE